MVGLPPMDKVHDIDAKRKTVTSAGKDSCCRAKKHGLRLQNFLSIWEKQILGKQEHGVHTFRSVAKKYQPSCFLIQSSKESSFQALVIEL
jgi:hypothetical protein